MKSNAGGSLVTLWLWDLLSTSPMPFIYTSSRAVSCCTERMDVQHTQLQYDYNTHLDCSVQYMLKASCSLRLHRHSGFLCLAWTCATAVTLHTTYIHASAIFLCSHARLAFLQYSVSWAQEFLFSAVRLKTQHAADAGQPMSNDRCDCSRSARSADTLEALHIVTAALCLPVSCWRAKCTLHIYHTSATVQSANYGVPFTKRHMHSASAVDDIKNAAHMC